MAQPGGLHVHPRFVFCWCVDGGGSIMVDGAVLSLRAGQGLLLFPFQQHHFHALSLLHTTTLPVGRVAELCGFDSVYAFSRAFHREKGIAPSAVRRGAG